MCSALTSLVMVCFSARIVTLVQLDGYKPKRTDKIKQILSKQQLVALATAVYLYIIYLLSILLEMPNFQHFIALLSLITSLYQIVTISTMDTRQRLAFTPRLIRWQVIYFVILFLSYWLGFWLGSLIVIEHVGLMYLFLPFIILLNWQILRLSLWLDFPIEKLIHRHFIKQAQTRLATYQDLIVIGVTGSCGKTSVKNFLTTILSANFKVFCTPHNYNTPMGICKAVQEMPAHTQIFVVEMGARQVGDIAELCEIVQPQYGILTTICPQHLDSFGNIQNIISTKCELVDYIADKSHCMIGDNEYLEQMQSKIKDCILVGANGFCSARNISCSSQGSDFDILIDDSAVHAHTSLIGKHNILNILLAVTCAYKLGMSLDTIASQISTIQPVEHRLQVTQNNGVTIIDDSYNSNVVGAKLAIDSLSLFDGDKIVMTQGVVELGKSQASQNFEIGAYIARVATKSIVFGVNSNDLRQGMLDGGMSHKDIFVVQNLQEAQSVLAEIVQQNSVVLIQNDLTDNY